MEGFPVETAIDLSKAGQSVASAQSNLDTAPRTSKEVAAEPSPLEISLISKGFKRANARAMDFEDDITFGLRIKNVSKKDIRAFDGVITFTDLLDNEILSSQLTINDPVCADSVVSWSGSIKYNQFLERHQRLRNEDQANIKLKFKPRKVLFKDGNAKVFSQQ
jgi:hypothetical protein